MKAFIALLLALGCFASLAAPSATEQQDPQQWTEETQRKLRTYGEIRARLDACKEGLASGTLSLQEAATLLIDYCESFHPVYLDCVRASEQTATLEEAVARNLLGFFRDDQASDETTLRALRSTRARLERELDGVVGDI